MMPLRMMLVAAILAIATTVFLSIKWKSHPTRRGLVLGVGFAVVSSMLLGLQCVSGLAALPGAHVANLIGLRGHPLWLLGVSVVNIAIYGPLGMAIGSLTARLTSTYPIGQCQTCGYDLTANVSGRCPECGAPT